MIPDDLAVMADAGLKSIAIITKTADQAATFCEKLHPRVPELNHLETNAQTFSRKLVIMPSYLSKGLEFDGDFLHRERLSLFRN